MNRLYDVSVWNNKESYDAWGKEHTDKEFIYISPGGTVHTNEETTKTVNQNFPKIKIDSIKTDDMRIRVFGDAALATYTLSYTGTRENKPLNRTDRITKMFVKRNGKWMQVLEQSADIRVSNKQKTTTTNKQQ